MANRTKGITVEIGGETTKLQTALKGVNGQIKNTQSALHDVERLLKLVPHKINFCSIYIFFLYSTSILFLIKFTLIYLIYL